MLREVKSMPQHVFIAKEPILLKQILSQEVPLGFPLTLIDFWVSGAFMK